MERINELSDRTKTLSRIQHTETKIMENMKESSRYSGRSEKFMHSFPPEVPKEKEE